MQGMLKRVALLILLALLCGSFPLSTGAAPAAALPISPTSSDDPLVAQLRQASGGAVQLFRHAETGVVRFLSMDARHPLAMPGLLANTATPEQAARAFLGSYGSLFGLRDQGQELTVM